MQSDKRMVAASQVAYMHLDSFFQEAMEKMGKNASFTFKEIAKRLTGDNLRIYNYIKNELASDIDDWKIVAVHDTNDKNGFSCCVMETPDGAGVVGFRGSEALTSLANGIHDWTEADILLINETCTKQQREVRNFLKRNKELLSRYNELCMTGHSLGGNLAEYATIVSEEYGLDGNITQCVSLDGPGFSGEFLKKYKDKIAHMSPKMKHYRWSFVGNLLNDLPDCEYHYVAVRNRDDDKYNSFNRHDTKYLDYDGDSLVEGEQDTLSRITQKISLGVDHMPSIIGNKIKWIAADLMIVTTAGLDILYDEDGNISVNGVINLIGTILVLTELNITSLIMAEVAAIIVAAIVAYAYEYVYEAVTEFINNVIEGVANMLETAYNWTKQKVREFKDAIQTIYNNIKEWYNSNFNKGYIYAQSYTEIRVDTGKLTKYATKLAGINKKLVSIDDRMDRLYSALNLFDKWNLMAADIRTNGSGLLASCVSYLNDTAREFDAVESTITGAM